MDGTDHSADSVEIRITGTELEEVHTVAYTNTKRSDKWLDANSDVRTNTATVVAATVIDMTEFKRNNIL